MNWEIATTIIVGILTAVQLNSRAQIKRAEAAATRAKATGDNAAADAEQAKATAEQARSAAGSIQALTKAVTDTVTLGTEERKRAEAERQEYRDFQRQQLVLQEQFVEAMTSNTAALKNHAALMGDIDKRIGAYAEENRRQMTAIVATGHVLESRLEAAQLGLNEATENINRLPGNVEQKIAPLLDRLVQVVTIVENASTNVVEAADAIQRVRDGFNEDFDELKDALIRAFKGENHEPLETI